jgi:hypothetical protein
MSYKFLIYIKIGVGGFLRERRKKEREKVWEMRWWIKKGITY